MLQPHLWAAEHQLAAHIVGGRLAGFRGLAVLSLPLLAVLSAAAPAGRGTCLGRLRLLRLRASLLRGCTRGCRRRCCLALWLLPPAPLFLLLIIIVASISLAAAGAVVAAAAAARVGAIAAAALLTLLAFLGFR